MDAFSTYTNKNLQKMKGFIAIYKRCYVLAMSPLENGVGALQYHYKFLIDKLNNNRYKFL